MLELVPLGVQEMDHALRWSLRVAVLGIKPESLRHRAAYYIPAYLADVGYEIVPVPVGFAEVDRILDRPVCRSLREAGDVDILSVFRRQEEVPAHLSDILELRPKLVWFQSGLMHVPSAQILVAAGIAVAHECIGCRRATISPTCAPLEGQTMSTRAGR
jgi:predicted CoA-binding protein